MTNGVNVEFIANKLLFFLESSSDDHFRTDLVEKLTLCAERYAPSNGWFVRTIIRVFELAGDKVQRNVANTLIQLLAEGSQEDDDSDSNDEDEDNEDDEDEKKDEDDEFSFDFLLEEQDTKATSITSNSKFSRRSDDRSNHLQAAGAKSFEASATVAVS